MFERFHELARRTIFFARYEAGLMHSGYIETEHMLLGLLREDPLLKSVLPSETREAIRHKLMSAHPTVPQESRLSVDIPMSADSQRSVVYGVEEADRLEHKIIHCGHLVLGLLRMEKSLACAVLTENGIHLEEFRELVKKNFLLTARHPAPRQPEFAAHLGPVEDKPKVQPPAAPSLLPVVDVLEALIGTADILYNWSEKEAEKHVEHWTRKQALGRLVDWTIAHQQWFAIALTREQLVAAEYPPDALVDVQAYSEVEWADLVNIWESLNRLIVHVLVRVPEDKLATSCRIGNAEPISLLGLITKYEQYSASLMRDIVAAS